MARPCCAFFVIGDSEPELSLLTGGLLRLLRGCNLRWPPHDRFLRTEEDDATATWEVKLAKRYYDKLFKEYCLADLSRYKEGKIGEKAPSCMMSSEAAW